MKIYLDNAASTPLFPEVIETMKESFGEAVGNPSSIHDYGRRAKASIELARRTIAGHLGSSIGEIFFTSGGTESNNTAIKCSVRDLGVERIITTPIEHHCVLHSVDRVAKDHQVEVVYVHVNADGEVSLDHLKEILAAVQKKTLVSIIHGNNEIGTIQDLQAIEDLCEEYNAYLHSDTVQTIGHHSFNLNERKIHFLSGSAHKFHGPKGVGFLYMNGDAILEPFVDGGAQERNMRAGTENVYGIEGMAKALDLSYQRFDQDRAFILKLRSQLKEGLIRLIPDISFNGKQDNNYLYTVLSAQFPQRIASDMLLMNLDVNGIAASGGSACSSGADQGSHVIRSIKPEDQGTTVRFSFSSMNTESEIEQTLKVLNQIIGGA